MSRAGAGRAQPRPLAGAASVGVVQRIPGPVLAGERQPGDLRHAHLLRRRRHHLCPPPRPHRPDTAVHDPPQPVAPSSPISRTPTRPAIPGSRHRATRQHVRPDQRAAGGQMPAATPPVVTPWRARTARRFRRVQDGAGGTAVRSPGLGRPGWGLFALVVGPLVLLEPYFGLDRGFPFAAVEGLPGAALGAGNDHLAHKCSLLWLITNAKPEQRSNPDTPGSCRASPNSPRGRRARGPRDEQGRIAATSSAPTPWEFRVQLGPPGRGMAGPGLSAWASSWPCGCVLSGKPWGSAACLTGPP